MALFTAIAGGPAGAAPRAGAPVAARPDVPSLPAVVPSSEAPKPVKQRGPSTLDASLEKTAEKLLRGAKPVEGAIVALDPKTGRVLVFEAIGAPSAQEVLTQARLPAASLFKVITTTALFETTSVTPQDHICINGGMHGIERRHLEPARGPSADCGRFAWALGNSKNAVFAQLATRLLTRDDLLKTAERIGFNQKLPLDGGDEQAELGKLTVPYNDLEFARAAAGFQGSSLSPIGAAYLMTLIARGGSPIGLKLHEGAPEAVDSPLAPPSPPPFSARTAQRLTRMLEVTVETGTSRGAFTAPDGKRYLPGIRVAGKTGTLRPEQSDTMTSWFVGFAPSRNPEIVVSVMLVNGHTYRRKANELARDLLRTYFRAHGHAQSVTDPFAESAPEPLAAAQAQ
ncbi:MAG TPA: penicillin-binding transpeptidase domain-containing protein [Polyangiaceae bacterium]|nr:penicillin-binding transpeptidase domain-containing protein [Polyangiaceae bacterium]